MTNINEIADALAEEIIEQTDDHPNQGDIIAALIGNLAQYLAD